MKSAEIVELDLDAALQYASTISLQKKSKLNAQPDPPSRAFTIIQRDITFKMESPVALDAKVADQFVNDGLEKSSDGIYTFETSAIEVKATTLGHSLVSIYNRALRKLKRKLLISINVLEDDLRVQMASELEFINTKLKKGRNHFFLNCLSWTLQLDTVKGSISCRLNYELSLITLFYRYFSSDVSHLLNSILLPDIVPYPTVEGSPSKYSSLPIGNQLFYKVITDHTSMMPAETKTFEHPKLLAKLLPFQKRSVNWLLQREGASYDDVTRKCNSFPLISESLAEALKSHHTNHVDQESWPNLDIMIQSVLDRLCFGWKRILFKNSPCWYNSYTGNILLASQMIDFLLSYTETSNNEPIQGCGLLCEEMGLGKTVEIVSLVLLHSRPENEINQDVSHLFTDEFRILKKAKTTLIAAPDSILKQWFNEISNICPHLLVTIYRGLGKYPELSNIPKYVTEYLQRFDIVLMNYWTMTRETDYANYSSRHAPTRSRHKRSSPTDDEEIQGSRGARDTKAGVVESYKAEFVLGNVSDQTDIRINQKKYDRAVIEELSAKISKEGVSSIPYTHFYESPLMACQWWRVVLDEVQMVSSGVSRAFLTASIIPRVHSWAVSGTPTQLASVLLFLKCLPFNYDISKYCWKRMVDPLSSNSDFVSLWPSLSLRHTKAMVYKDIVLPPQHRVLFTVPFTDVEQDKYNEVLESTLASIGLSTTPKVDQLDLSLASFSHLRSHLVKLRQLCGNSQVGKLPSVQSGKKSSRNIFLQNGLIQFKTLEDVLDEMIVSVCDDINEAAKIIINRMIDVCLALEYVLYPEKVIEILNSVHSYVEQLILRTTVQNREDGKILHSLRLELSQYEVLKKKDMEDFSEDEYSDSDANEETKVSGVKLEKSEIQDEEKIQQQLLSFRKYKEKVQWNQLKLRSWKLCQHKCFFLLASAHFQMYDPEYREKINRLRIPFPSLQDLDSSIAQADLLGSETFGFFNLSKPEKKETDIHLDLVSGEDKQIEHHKLLETNFYALAEKCRNDILKHPIKEVSSLTAKKISSRTVLRAGDWINDGETHFPKTTLKLFTAMPQIEIADLLPYVGDSKSKRLVEQFTFLVNQLNSQSLLINEYLEMLMETICKPLLTTEKTPDGEEYEESLKDQDKVSSLMLILNQLLQDRHNATFESETKVVEIIKHQEKDFSLEAQSVNDKDFLKSLQKRRVKVIPKSDIRFEEILQDTRVLEIEYKFGKSTKLEEPFGHIARIIRCTFENEKICQSLMKKESNSSFNAVFNSRVEYFKQLQQISDSVENTSMPFSQEEFEEEKIDRLFRGYFTQLAFAKNKLCRSISRWKYLNTLLPKDVTSKKEDSPQMETDDEKLSCVICRCVITVGSLIACGHKFCKPCLDEWLSSRRSCPLCKCYTDRESVYSFTLYASNLKAQKFNSHREVNGRKDPLLKDELHQVYKQLEPDVLSKIMNVKLNYSYGSKVDLIVKHILYLKSIDPQVQIVVFSQWQDLLVILACAFDKADVSYVSAKGSHVASFKNKKLDPVEEFKRKDKIHTCFLLNSQAQASGLTLINATQIFLCEPLVNTPTELQAISRIHRIGQTKETTVWMFAIENTVEENIVSLGTRKRIEYLNANSDNRHLDQLEESDLRDAESVALTYSTGAPRIFSGTSENVENSELLSVYFGQDTKSDEACEETNAN